MKQIGISNLFVKSQSLMNLWHKRLVKWNFRHLATISEMVEKANEQENFQPPDPLEAWRLVRNSNKQAQFQQLPRLIHVKPAPNTDE